MGTSKHVAVWPRVRVTVKGKSKIIDRGDLVPDGVSAVDLDNLVSFGAIAGATLTEAAGTTAGPAAPAVTPTPFDPAKGGNAPDTMAWVGTDQVRAQEVLTLEQAKERPRVTLVAELEAVIKGDS